MGKIIINKFGFRFFSNMDFNVLKKMEAIVPNVISANLPNAYCTTLQFSPSFCPQKMSYDSALCHSFQSAGELMSKMLAHSGTQHATSERKKEIRKVLCHCETLFLEPCDAEVMPNTEQKYCPVREVSNCAVYL